MNRPTARQVEDSTYTLLVGLAPVLLYVVVTNPTSSVAAWLIAAILPLIVVTLAASTVQWRRRDLANQAAARELQDSTT